MKKIAIFAGGRAVIDTDSKTTVRIDGKLPQSVIPLTESNFKKHFKGVPFPHDKPKKHGKAVV